MIYEDRFFIKKSNTNSMKSLAFYLISGKKGSEKVFPHNQPNQIDCNIHHGLHK